MNLTFSEYYWLTDNFSEIKCSISVAFTAHNRTRTSWTGQFPDSTFWFLWQIICLRWNEFYYTWTKNKYSTCITKFYPNLVSNRLEMKKIDWFRLQKALHTLWSATKIQIHSEKLFLSRWQIVLAVQFESRTVVELSQKFYTKFLLFSLRWNIRKTT